MMLPGNAIEFELDGEMYLGLISPYNRYEAAELESEVNSPAVFPLPNGVQMMMQIVNLDDWIATEEAAGRG